MVLVNITVFFALIAIHEIAHVAIGYYLGCVSGRAVLFDTNAEWPYAELSCPVQTSHTLINISSLLVTGLFGVMFLLSNSTNRNLFYIIIGFSLVFGALDISIATGVQFLFYSTTSLGFVLLIVGEYLIALSCIRKEDDG
jgi:hypothetical protein